MSVDRLGPKRVRLSERTMLACIHCKSKKLKCDGQVPKCQTCVRTGRDCLVEDPATGLHRPRDYLQSLETRVAYLEGLLQEARPDVASDHFNGFGQPRFSQNIGQASIASPQHGSLHPEAGNETPTLQGPFPGAARDTEGEELDDLTTDVAVLCLSAAGREPHYFGSSCAVSFSRIVSATMGFPKRHGSSQHSGTIPNAHGQEIQRTVSVSFPSPSLATTLTQAYFKNIHPQYPFLHKPTFLAWEQTCLRANAANALSEAGDLALFFVLMVYAIGSLALGPAHRDVAEAYYVMALDHQATVLDLDGLESVQSILSCAVYSIRSPVGVSLWKLSGMAIRHCIELGYHRNISKYHKHTDTLAAEMSRRCFWVAYDIDRVAACILGRPVGIPDDAIDVEMPLDLEDEYIARDGLRKEPRSSPDDQPTYMTGAIHVIRLRRLWSKIASNLYQTATTETPSRRMTETSVADRLREELEGWYAAIPDPIVDPGSSLSVFATQSWFQIAYDHSILLLYRHQITIPSSPGHEENMEQAFADCANRAREMCLLYRKLYQNPTIQYTWGSLHILFVGGMTYLYCLWKSAKVRLNSRQSDVISTCMACNTVLIVIAERWTLATPYRDAFETLSQRTIDMVCNERSGTSDFNSHQSDAGTTQQQGNTAALSQGWDIGLNDLSVPHETEWLFNELLQGMRDFQQPEFGFEDLGDFTG